MEITSEDRVRVKETLKNLGREKTDEEIFYDLCFCICAPQTTFKSNSKAIKNLIDADFRWSDQSLEEIEVLVKPTRFYKNKAKYLYEARWNFHDILKIVKLKIPGFEKREMLVANVKGLGYKTASHFLRNLGDDQLAIIDTHIIKYLAEERDYSKARYLEMEKKFQIIAKEKNLTPAELDAIVWKKYSNTEWEDFKF